jgi:ATP-dependent helicase STH1/SNF2
VDGDSSRRTATKNVTYDDGLTERQFLRLVEKEAKGEEDAVTARKQNRKLKLQKTEAVDNPVAVPAVNNGHVVTPQSGKRKRGMKSPAKPQQTAPTAETNRGALTDWTHRKLINACKAVIAVREPTTKRKLSDIFMEKPCPATYPDYYQLIQTPIAINDILRKCKDSLYSTIAEYRDDWDTMFANARKYNAEGTWICVDAGVLESELDRIMDKNSLKDSAIPAPAPAPAPPSVKKKPLRIKLSLKIKIPAKAPEITQNASTSDSSSVSSVDTNDGSSVDSD